MSDREENKIMSTKIISIDAKSRQEEVEKRPKRDNKRIIILAGIVLITLALGLLLFNRFFKHTKYKLISEKEISQGSFVAYERFEDNVVKYSKDGAICMNSAGKELWIESYEMKDPVIATSKKYLAIADRKGNAILTFSKSGKLGEIKTLLPITKVVISDTGIVVAILEDSSASYISFYDYDGKSLDISVKAKLSGDGYPTDISISPNGTQLMVSYEYVESGELKGRVVFYDFSEIGKSIANRLVGGFDEAFTGSLLARVKHFNSMYSFAIADTGIYFFSTKNLLSPELIKTYAISGKNTGEIYSIAYNDKYLAVVYKTIDGEAPYKLEVYRDNGSVVFTKNINSEFTYFDIDDTNIYFGLEGSGLKIYNMSGVLKVDINIETNIEYIKKGSLFGRYIIFGKSGIQEIQPK